MAKLSLFGYEELGTLKWTDEGAVNWNHVNCIRFHERYT